MRPDEHKKKKSRQYQKKHATYIKKTESGPTTGNISDNAQKNQHINNAGSIVNKNNELRATNASNRENNLYGSESGSDELPQQVAFRRRKIDSNWARYEEGKGSNDCVESQKVYDFQQLLQKSVNAESQFKLQDEKEWDENTGHELDLDLLAIDCYDLGRAIQTLPLAARYGIEEEARDAGFLTLNGETNFTNILSQTLKSKSLSAPEQHLQLNLKLASEKLATTANICAEITSIAKDLSRSSNMNSEDVDKYCDNCNEEELMSQQFWTSEDAKSSVELTQTNVLQHEMLNKCTESYSRLQMQNDDDQLDMLLLLEKPTGKEHESSLLGGNSLPKEDSLTNIERKSEAPSNNVQKDVNIMDSNVEELEDWLDSVLDD